MTLTIPTESKVCGNTSSSPVVNLLDVKHDREMIEQSFKTNTLLTEADMKERFGKYGWGE